MNLSAKYDIEAPVDFVYRELTDFAAWERMAKRHGAEVTRIGPVRTPGPGMEWQVAFVYRSKARSTRLHLTEATPTTHITVSATSKPVEGSLTFDLIELAPARTRIDVRMVVKPKTLAARIYVQTLKLARKKVESSFSQRVAQLAVEMEDRHRRPSAKKV